MSTAKGISGLAVGYLTFGGLLLWSGLSGKPVKQVVSSAAHGKLAGSLSQISHAGGYSPPANLRQSASQAASSPGGAYPTPTGGQQAVGSSGNPLGEAGTPRGGTPARNRALAKMMAQPYGWSKGRNWTDLVRLWNRESGWSQKAQNPASGAYGIPQALPASKMASAGSNWKTSAATQIKWGLGYIKSRYGSPSSAWAHEQSHGWY